MPRMKGINITVDMSLGAVSVSSLFPGHHGTNWSVSPCKDIFKPLKLGQNKSGLKLFSSGILSH